jgi:tartronate-semialdehyde synthase
VQVAFENQNIPESEGDLRTYGVDHQAVLQGLELAGLLE